MQRWYNGTNKYQRILMFFAACVLVFAYGIGFVPLFFLLYCHFGSMQPGETNASSKTPPKGSKEYLDWANREGRWADPGSKES